MLRYVLEPGLAQRPSEQAVDSNSIHRQQKAAEDPEAILQALRATTIGAAEEVHTPFGLRRTVYADYTASGRASSIVEDFVRDQVLPRYGNTHTLATATARQTTYFRAEAREVIRHHLNATHEDAVIFAGNGSTGAAHLLVQTMQRAGFNVGASPGASASAGETVRDMYFREDRWGGGECTLCGVRVKSANIYQAHRHSEAHRAKLCAKEQSSDAHSGQGDVPALRRRRVVVLADAVLHHSSSLPFHELVPQYPLTGVAAMSGFSGGCWRMTAASSNQSPAQDVPLAHASGVEVEVSTVPVDVTTGLLDESEFRQRLEALRSWTGTASRTDVGGDGAGGVTQDCQLVVICILAAASNVTGLCADVPHLTGLARGIIPGAIVCWDFAASLGHQVCNLNPPGDAAAFVDAAFFSPHKLWGGPGSVGILAVKKRILCNAVPAVPGGGVVFYVSDAGHSYIQNSEEREEAGTPNIVGCIRAGLVFHTLDQLPVGLVASREGSMLERVLAAWGDHPRIDVLGPGLNSSNSVVSRTGVVSFMIRYGNASLDCICTTTMWSLCSTISSVCRLVEVALVPGPTLSGFWESVLSCRSRWSIAWRKARRRCCVPASSVWVCIGRCPMTMWRCSSLLSVGSPTTAGSCWPPTPSTGKQASGSTGWMFPSAGACGSQTCTSLLLPLLHRRRRRWPQRPSLDSRRG